MSHPLLQLGTVCGQEIWFGNFKPWIKAVRNGHHSVERLYLVQFGWFAGIKDGGLFTEGIRWFLEKHDNAIFQANSAVEYGNLLRIADERNVANVSAHLINTIRNDAAEIFTPGPKPFAERKFNGVLNARRSRYKRRYLADGIANLALIIPNQFDQADDEISGSHWVNDRRLKPTEVAGILHESRIGLQLSYSEGQNRATLEYLLAGLPVLTVESKGGRHVLLDESNSLTVPRNRDESKMNREIVEAAHCLIERTNEGEFSPERIRRDCLRRLRWLFEELSRKIAGFMDDSPEAGVRESFFSACRERAPVFGNELNRLPGLAPNDPGVFGNSAQLKETQGVSVSLKERNRAGIVTRLHCGLGNQIFQYCFGRLLARRLGLSFACEGGDLFSTVFPDAKRQIPGRQVSSYTEDHVRGHQVDLEALEARHEADPSRGFQLKGHFERIEYYRESRNEIRQWLGLHNLGPADDVVPEDDAIVLHVRTQPGEHRHMKREYYKAAIEALRTEGKDRRIIVTDKPESKMVTQLMDRQKGFTIRSSEDPGADFRFLLRARRLILPHSTFSWWAGWLGEAESIVMTGPKYDRHSFGGFWGNGAAFSPWPEDDDRYLFL